MRTLLTVAFFTSIVLGEQAPTKTWLQWEIEGNNLMDAGRYVEASAALRNALAMAIHANESCDHLIAIHNALGSAYANEGRYYEAKESFSELLELERKAHGRDSLVYALVSAAISLLPTHTGLRDHEIKALRAAIAEGQRHSSRVELVLAQDYLAKLLYADHRLNEAGQAISDAAFSHAAIGDPFVNAGLLNDEGVILEQSGYSKEAAQHDEEAIQILENVLGVEHPALIAPLNNLATVYAKENRLADSERVFQRAVALCRKAFGENHPTYGDLLRSYAVVVQRLGRKKESKHMKAEAERIAEATDRQNGIGATIDVSSLRAENHRPN